MTKTNAMRLLDAAGISYRAMDYEYDEKDLSGSSAAKALGVPEDRVFKTLVVRGEKKGLSVFCIPVQWELDLKKAAAVSGNKRVELIPVRELLGLTGYIRGGCSPVGMKKSYPTYIDESAVLFDEIAVSAGTRGLQLMIDPMNLISYLKAKAVDATKQGEKTDEDFD